MLLYNSKSASTSLTLTAELKKWHTDQRLSQKKEQEKERVQICECIGKITHGHKEMKAC